MVEIQKVSFLTDSENACIQLLNEAQKLFNKISDNDPQDPSDTYNFGHYLAAARNAVIIRGARRLDPDNLMPKRKERPAITYPPTDLKE